jgi:site-specific DNA-adenine methylase
MTTQGGKANKTGNTLERFIMHTLDDKGYTFIDRKNFQKACFLHQPFYTRQYHIGQSVYGTDLNCDFILFHPEKHPNRLIIECKWQQSTGTTDEKYPYFVLNIKEKFNCPTIVLLDGEGYRTGAGAWLRSQVDDKLLHVFTMGEFTKWANNGNI